MLHRDRAPLSAQHWLLVRKFRPAWPLSVMNFYAERLSDPNFLRPLPGYVQRALRRLVACIARLGWLDHPEYSALADHAAMLCNSGRRRLGLLLLLDLVSEMDSPSWYSRCLIADV
jgi:hypothetical protein